MTTRIDVSEALLAALYEHTVLPGYNAEPPARIECERASIAPFTPRRFDFAAWAVENAEAATASVV